LHNLPKSTQMAETMELTKSIDASNLEAWLIVRIDPAKSLAMAEKCLAESESLNYQKGIAWSYGNIGAAHTWLGNYELALQNSFKGLELLREVGDQKHEVQILYTILLFSIYWATMKSKHIMLKNRSIWLGLLAIDQVRQMD
jgi:hypothetical protein